MNPLGGFKTGSKVQRRRHATRRSTRGIGPPPDPNSARSKARAAKAARAVTSLPSPVAVLQPIALVQSGEQAAGSTAFPVKSGREQPLDLMFRLMASDDPRIQLQAAIAAAPYVHPKLVPVKSKSEEKEKKPSRFTTSLPPVRLIVNK